MRKWIVIVLTACACSGCDFDLSFLPGVSITNTLKQFAKADRMVMKTRAGEVIRVSTDPNEIANVVSFVNQYPSGWMTFSGAGGDYEMYLYEGAGLIGDFGITRTSDRRPGKDTLNVGEYLRRAPASEVEILMRDLRLPWPVRSK